MLIFSEVISQNHQYLYLTDKQPKTFPAVMYILSQNHTGKPAFVPENEAFSFLYLKQEKRLLRYAHTLI